MLTQSQVITSEQTSRPRLWAVVMRFGAMIVCFGHDVVQEAKSILARLTKYLAAHRLFPVRQRYVLTRGRRLRLRYRFAGLAALSGLLGLFALSGLSPSSSALVGGQDVQSQRFTAVQGGERFKGQAQSSLQDAVLAQDLPEEPKFTHKTMTVGSGQTIAGLLQKAGIGASESYKAVQALSAHYDPRQIKPGQSLTLAFAPGADFAGFDFVLSPVEKVSVTRAEDGAFTSAVEKEELTTRTYARRAQIQNSLYGSAMEAGVPMQVIGNLIRVYSWDVDFQRDIRAGDSIEVLYETNETEDGSYSKYGDILYARLNVGGREVPIYRYEMANGNVDYFEANGRSIRKALMRTPVDGARISSGYGMRLHPILGYNKMHKGVDFAAPTGTPIYAAGDGTLEYVGRRGAYGNYMRIRHNSSLKTAYAHLHKYARGMRAGKRVKQGEVIGYVGSTGRSTGPHLHYEVLKNGVQVNPRRVDMPTGEKLKGEELQRFKSRIGDIEQRYASLMRRDGPIKLAQNVLRKP